MPEYSDLVQKLTALKDAMRRRVDPATPDTCLLAQIEFLESQIDRFANIHDDTNKMPRYGRVMSIVQMPRYLYDDRDWRECPEVDRLIGEATDLAWAIIKEKGLGLI